MAKEPTVAKPENETPFQRFQRLAIRIVKRQNPKDSGQSNPTNS